MELEDLCRFRNSLRDVREAKPRLRPGDWKLAKEYRHAPRWIASPRRSTNDSLPAAARFAALKEKWERETANVSSISEIVLNDAYQQIIGMGQSALPIILQSLREAPTFWFPALRAITGEDPVKQEDRGNIEAMRASWLNWAALNGFSNLQS